MNIAKYIRHHRKHAGQDIAAYWNATRFLWRVFTHAKNSPQHSLTQPHMRAYAAMSHRARVPSFRARVLRAQHAKEQAHAHRTVSHV